MTEIDHGLQYSTIVPTLEEWNKSHAGLFAKQYGPLHLWTKCVDGTFRGYLFHEALSGLNYNVAADQSVRHLKIAIDGKNVDAIVTRAGVEFYWHIHNSFSTNSTLLLTINDWIHGALLFSKHCQLSNTQQHNLKPNLVMNVYTWDEIHSQPVDSQLLHNLVNAIARHASYSQCVLNLTTYEVIIHEKQMHYFLNNQYILEQNKLNFIQFKFKTNHPATLNIKSVAWQAVFENIAVLQYWTENVRLLFWDPDEYLYYDPNTHNTLMQLIYNSDVLSFYRSGVVKSSDYVDATEQQIQSFRNTKYHKVDKNIASKISISPNHAGCVYVHASHCSRHNEVKLDPTIGYIVHFENYYIQRIKPSNEMKYVNLSWLDHCDSHYLDYLHNKNDTDMTLTIIQHDTPRYDKHQIPHSIIQEYQLKRKAIYSLYFVTVVSISVFIVGIVFGVLCRRTVNR